MTCLADVVIDGRDASGPGGRSQTIVVGTEFGIFVTEDGERPGTSATWGSVAPAVTAPVFDLSNSSVILTNGATSPTAVRLPAHGRGMFVNGIASSVQEEAVVNDERAWSVFPNPVVAGELNLPTAGWQGTAQVEIFDMTGRRWASQTVQLSGVGRIQADVQELPSGYYVVRMAQDGRSKAAKFVVRQ